MEGYSVMSLVAILLCSLIVQSSSNPDERRLVADILNAYSRSARPVKDVSDALELNLGFSLLKVTNFDQEKHELSLLGWVELDWNDFVTSWEPSEYGGIERIVLEPDQIWSPNIVLLNVLEKPQLVHADYVTVKADGRVTWTRELAVKVFCDPDTSGPEQSKPSCDLNFGTWTLTSDMVSLASRKALIDTSHYVSNVDWELYKTKATQKDNTFPCCPEDTYPAVTYTIQLKAIPKEDEDADKDKDSGACALTYSLAFASLVSSLVITSLH